MIPCYFLWPWIKFRWFGGSHSGSRPRILGLYPGSSNGRLRSPCACPTVLDPSLVQCEDNFSKTNIGVITFPMWPALCNFFPKNSKTIVKNCLSWLFLWSLDSFRFFFRYLSANLICSKFPKWFEKKKFFQICLYRFPYKRKPWKF